MPASSVDPERQEARSIGPVAIIADGALGATRRPKQSPPGTPAPSPREAGVHPDTVRMDWLADKNNIIGNVQLPAVCVMNNLHDMRAAIDEAVRLDPEIAAEIAAAPEPVGVG